MGGGTVLGASLLNSWPGNRALPASVIHQFRYTVQYMDQEVGTFLVGYFRNSWPERERSSGIIFGIITV
jgi:hypothetical protein